MADTEKELYVGAPIRSADTIGLCRTWVDGPETGEETVAEVLPTEPPSVAEKDAADLIHRYNAHKALFMVAVAISDLERDNGANVTGPVWRDMIAKIATQARKAITNFI